MNQTEDCNVTEQNRQYYHLSNYDRNAKRQWGV